MNRFEKDLIRLNKDIKLINDIYKDIKKKKVKDAEYISLKSSLYSMFLDIDKIIKKHI